MLRLENHDPKIICQKWRPDIAEWINFTKTEIEFQYRFYLLILIAKAIYTTFETIIAF